MPTITKETAAFQKVQTTAVAANNAVTLGLSPTPPSGQSAVIDWINIGFNGTTQTIASWNVQDAGGGTTYISGYVTSGVAGLASQHMELPGGLKCPAAQAVELTVGALTNCAIRASIGWHLENA